MNRMIKSLAIIGAVLMGSHAIADDSMSRASMTQQQMLKDCIEKQKTADVNMSKAQMKRICKDQLKQQKATGTPVDAPPTDAPHN